VFIKMDVKVNACLTVNRVVSRVSDVSTKVLQIEVVPSPSKAPKIYKETKVTDHDVLFLHCITINFQIFVTSFSWVRC
jgi:hypothetical protein